MLRSADIVPNMPGGRASTASNTIRFSGRYTLREELGRGAFAVVYRCIDVANGKQFAVKVINKDKLTNRDIMKLEIEARVCKKLNHINIVRLHAVISDPKTHYFVFDLITGGELFDDIVKQDNYTEELTAKCMVQLLETIRYIHKMGVVHRDLKPENILLESVETKIIKLADFGLAVEVEGDEMKWFGMAGTPHYMAPEVYETKPYGKPVDLWACGVIMYILLVGYQPFYHKNEVQLQTMIKAGDYEMSSDTWRTISYEAKDLLRKLLCVEATRRYTAVQSLAHPWFKVSKKHTVHKPETVDRLIQFNARRKFKAAFHTISAVRSLQDAFRSRNTA